MYAESPPLQLQESPGQRKAALGLSLLACFIGLVVLAGWALDIHALKSIVPGPVTMKANTALGLLACGAALAMLCIPGPSIPRRRGVLALGCLVMLLAGVSLSQDLTGLNLGIDQWLFRDPDISPRAFAGRMSPPTAFCLILLGVALACLSQSTSPRWRLPIAFGLGVAVVIVALLALVGNLANALVGARFWNFSPIAADSAVALALLGAALILFVRGEGGIAWSIDAFTGSGFIVGIVALLLTATSTYYLARQLQQDVERLAQSQEVLKAVEELARDLADTTSALRAYVIVGDERWAILRDQKTAEMMADFKTVRSLSSAYPAQQSRLDRLEIQLAQRAQRGNQVMAARRTQGFAAAQQLVAGGQGSAMTDNVNQLLAEIRDEQHQLAAQQRSVSEETSRRTFLTMPLGVFISVTLLLLGLFMLNRSVAERRHSQNALQEREALFRAIFDATPDGIIVADSHGFISLANPGTEKMLGYGRSALKGMPVIRLMPGTGEEAVQQERASLVDGSAQGRIGKAWELDAVHHDGALVPVEVIRSAFWTPRGHFVVGVVRDITARREAQKKNQRLTDFYAALSQTNQAVVHARDEQALFQEICGICVRHGHASIANIALVSGNTAVPTVSAGAVAGFLIGAPLTLDPSSPEGRGPLATSIQTGKPYVSNDFFSDPRTLPWRDRAAALGTQSMAVFPFRRAGEIAGVLSLHMREKNFFDGQLIELVTEMVADLSFALDNLDRESARALAQASLRASEHRIRNLFEQAADGIFILTADHHFVEGNRAGLQMLGYTREELLTLRLPDVLAPHERVRLELAASHMLADTPHVQEWEHLRKDGSRFPGEVSARALDSGQYLAIVRDLTERRQAEGRVQHLATHDGLTDLPNQNLMRDRMARAMSQARRAGRQLALMSVDLDRFKVINDAYGHPFGDKVLIATAQKLRSLMRDEDTVARHHGDKFLVLLPELRRSADAYIAAQKIVDAFAVPFALEGREVHLTVSIGVSVYPQNGEDADTLIGNADVAMYRAKERGRASYQFFTQEMSDQTRHHVALETQLRVAMAQHELHLVYQPKVDLGCGGIVGCEALVRWSHPQMGLISPVQFIPVAEESGLIVPLGDWVLRTACRQALAWQEAGLPAVPVSVNVSARQFLQQDVVGWVMRTLDEVGLEPKYLELELTESLIAQDAEKVIETVVQLKAAGVKLSIDDFGTGYSSLSYLKRFRVDTLKIDQSFIRNMLKDPEDAVIPLAVISLAHALKLNVIAEGVETAEHCAFLRAHGCDEMQGYFFSKPVPAEEFAEMLKSGKHLVMD